MDNITVWIMGILVAFIAVSDIWLIRKYGKQATYSANIIRFFTKHKKGFVTGFLIGFVFGHLFWSMPTESVYPNKECKEVLK